MFTIEQFLLSENIPEISGKSFSCLITGNREEARDGFYRYLQWFSALPLEVFGTDSIDGTNLPHACLKEESTLAGNCMSKNTPNRVSH
jgi:hypothetical protein